MSGDGRCFIESVRKCLLHDLDVDYSCDVIADKIFDEIIDNSNNYQDFHTGSKKDLIEDTLSYLKYRKFTIDVVDVVVQACANALKVNLHILTRGDKDMCQVICANSCIKSNRDIVLKYDRFGGIYHSSDHYSAVVKQRPQLPNTYPTTNTNLNNPPPSTNTCDKNSTIDLVSEGGERSNVDFYDEFGDIITDETQTDNILKLTSTSQKQKKADMHQPRFRQSVEPSDVESVHEILSSDNEPQSIPEEFQRPKRSKRRKYQKTRIQMWKFKDMNPQRVDNIPWDVDGANIYRIICRPDEWVDKSHDGRWFQMNTSARKGLDGVRKTGTCQGSLLCENPKCSKLLTEGVCNLNEFSKDSYGQWCCKCCGYYVVRAHCGCKKISEYENETHRLTIWYEGEHNCIPKPDIKNKRNFLKSLPLNTGLRDTPHEAAIDLIQMYLAQDKINKAVEMIRQIDDIHLLEKLRYVRKHPLPNNLNEDEFDAFRNIRQLKEKTDKKDPFLIYAINFGGMNDEPSYVFKTHRYGLETAFQMDPTKKTVRGRRSLLSYEKAYFDGMHKRCRGYKTLTLWTHHPGMRRMRRLATMEVQRENTESVALFFKLFNKALQEYTGDDQYKFNPSVIMTDEAGANIQGLQQVFGPAFVERIVTCQFHFKQCAWRQLIHIIPQEKESFKDAVEHICYAPTVTEYQRHAEIIENICRSNKILRWYNWWKARRYHISPAFRGYGWTGTNWAEIGHSTFRHKKVWLIYAAFHDVAECVMQENDHYNFVNNKGKTVGRGPTSLDNNMKEKEMQKRFTQSACDAFETGNMADEVGISTDPAATFLPTSSAKHRVPKSFSTKNPEQKDQRKPGNKKGKASQTAAAKKAAEKKKRILVPEEVTVGDIYDEFGDVVNSGHTTPSSGPEDQPQNSDDEHNDADDEMIQPSNEPQQNLPSAPQRRVQPKRKRKGRNRRYESHVESSTDEELEEYNGRRVPAEKEKKKMASNPPTYVLIWDRVKRCNGCRIEFSPFHRSAPNNLIFRYVTKREYPDPRMTGKWLVSDKPGNAYYHARDLHCLRRVRELENVQVDDLYIENKTFFQLSPEHKQVLSRRGHLKPLKRARAQLIDN